ncbi:MAG TPA: chloride channel protein, partial [Candidatus Nanoarchaeia archaeon]|nr:chloride channel protein [Candidatus Nanoarchaeia archaeon]
MESALYFEIIGHLGEMSKLNDGIRYYLLVAGVGLLAAAISVGFNLLYLGFQNITQSAISFSLLVIFPLSLSALLVPFLLVKYLADTKTTGSGTHTVLEAYHLSNGEINLRDAIVKPTASILTIGLGGSAGPEGPSLLAGGGVASAVSRRFKVPADLRRRLFIAGAAAGLAATFRTPLTAILFALEIPYKNDLDREMFIEAVVASVPAYLVAIAALGSQPLFGSIGNVPLSLNEIVFSLLLGLICGLYAIFFTKTFSWTEQFAFKLKKRVGNYGLISLGAMILTISGVFSLYTIGVGLQFVNAIVKGTAFTLAVLVIIVLLKTLTTSITLNFGGSGGLFFPTIIVGAGIGLIFSSIFNLSYPVLFIAVGMAALLSGTHKILLTPVAFVVETLGGIFAIPALLASGVSYLVSGQHSFYPLQPRTRLKTEELALERFYVKGEKLIPDKLKATAAKDFMTRNPVTLRQGMTIWEALETFKGTKFRVLPIIDEGKQVVGVINLEDLGYVDIYHKEVSLSESVMHKPLLIDEKMNLEEIAQLMMEKQQDHVFVVDGECKLTG